MIQQLNYRVVLRAPGAKLVPPEMASPNRNPEMLFSPFDDEMRFMKAWGAVNIVREARQGLFTFDQTELPYYLVCGSRKPGATVSIRKGEVRVSRPLIITPDDVRPEFENFFEEQDDEGQSLVHFLLARTAAFKNLRIDNTSGPKKIVSDSVEEVVDKLNKQLDMEDEDRVAILTAPPKLGGIALLKYTTERVMASAPDNVQELRERGFLP